MAGTRTDRTSATAQDEMARNEVILCGRLAEPAQERTLPSGDTIVTLRMVIPRLAGPPRPSRAARAVRKGAVDTIDVVCWTAASRRAALRLDAGGAIEVEGALRRRFFGGPGAKQSRYEVEAGLVRRPSGRTRFAS